ncbi:MarR family transcriptional regulator [Vibrio cyclitrophicus]
MSFLCQNEPINEALITAARVVPHQVARVKLSKTQLRVLESISEGEMVTASQIAGRLGLSVSWASSVLKRVRDKHYLQRTGGVRNCGGVEYSYWK